MTVRLSGIALVAVTMALVTPSFARPAHAHHGDEGPVRLYLETVRVEPQAKEWAIRAALNDTSSGKPAPGFLVQATGSGPQGAVFGPVSLADSDADGRYEAGLGPLPAGDWSLTLDVSDAPGGEDRAIPITRTATVTLQPGQGVDVIGRRDASAAGDGASAGSSSVATPLMLGAGVVALLGVTASWRSRRRRAMVPAR